MEFEPKKAQGPVVKPGEFAFSAAGLDHGHIVGMCAALIEAGATLKTVYDPDPAKVEGFLKRFPTARAADCLERLLDDPETRLVAGAAVPSERCALGLEVMAHGKDYFTDKTPITTLGQLEAAKEAVKRTGRKYMCYYSERLHSESAEFAGQLVAAGAIGRVIHVDGFGPHRIGPLSGRPGWFWKREKTGGILCDIGSHQIEQFLFYAEEEDARVQFSRAANYHNPEYPEFDDFGDCALVGKNGATNYFRVDWFTPAGLRTWGDGRTFILGTEGYIELRKYVDVGVEPYAADCVILADGRGEHRFSARGKTGFPFFGRLILDCLERTENAMTQAHCFKAAELCVAAQDNAVDITPGENRGWKRDFSHPSDGGEKKENMR
jgi:predicted dehydrogenase